MSDATQRPNLSLILAGGGITGAMYEFGALQALDHFFSGPFTVNDFGIYVGTSAGAVVAALMANGVPPGEVGRAIIHNTESPLNFKQEDIVSLDWAELKASLVKVWRMIPALFRFYRRNPRLFSLARLLYALEENLPPGIYSLAKYQAYLRRLLTRPGSVNTFDDLKRELYIPATHLDTGERVMFGAPGWRDVPISDAIAASSALPLYFQPLTVKGMDFVDGVVGGVAHVDLPIERGSRFLLLLNPIIPIRNQEGVVCIPTFSGHCARIREKGITFVVDQTQRISSREKLALGLDRFRAQHPEVRFFLVEPPPSDSILFMENILNYGSRVAMLNYGYRSTARLLRAQFETFRQAFAAYGIGVSLEGLREDNPWEPPTPLAVPPHAPGVPEIQPAAAERHAGTAA
ncbi:MAG TPA: patatin-like phospholipase family protein [Candidatus Polarisedimenticolia bacterium]|nr:patatin-like phospholipase family protein [Candidatus Polarisedimenticolia bacterium]